MKYLFLDLENTVIDSWESSIILNNLEIQKEINLINPDKIGILSFAIWNNVDKENFYSTLLDGLNRAYNILIDPELVFNL